MGETIEVNRSWLTVDRVAAALILILISSAAHAAENCTPIRFAPGTSSATVKGIATSMDEGKSSACYTLTTRAGQTASLTIVK
ncbi:MAG: hypothetical protein WBX30_06530, partial [Stellaceae bacterium]